MKKLQNLVANQYNIIIGQDYDCGEYATPTFTAYKKSFRNHINTCDIVESKDLSKPEYIFTQKEIDCLKQNLPVNMAKIIEMGKVEVEVK